MYKLRRKLLSQNFLHSQGLVNFLVQRSSIGKNDLVLEIGPGKGIITESLLAASQHVIAVEIDTYWYNYLIHYFSKEQHITLYHRDILSFDLPALPYKVFANIPFAIEGKILRYLLDATNPPNDTYLVMMKELAYRISAPYKENQLSLCYKPWFSFVIEHEFKRSDFTPRPSVHAVLLRISKRPEPLLSWNQKRKYQKFIVQAFKNGQPVVKNLSQRYDQNRVEEVFHHLSIARNTTPRTLTFSQWVSIYKVLSVK